MVSESNIFLSPLYLEYTYFLTLFHKIISDKTIISFCFTLGFSSDFYLLLSLVILTGLVLHTAAPILWSLLICSILQEWRGYETSYSAHGLSVMLSLGCLCLCSYPQRCVCREGRDMPTGLRENISTESPKWKEKWKLEFVKERQVVTV